MTLPSPRKHRTTRRNTLPASEAPSVAVGHRSQAAFPLRFSLSRRPTSWRLWALGLGLAGLLGATGFAQENNTSAPLDRLKSRSASQRWDEMRRDYLQNNSSAIDQLTHPSAKSVGETTAPAAKSATMQISGKQLIESNESATTVKAPSTPVPPLTPEEAMEIRSASRSNADGWSPSQFPEFAEPSRIHQVPDPYAQSLPPNPDETEGLIAPRVAGRQPAIRTAQLDPVPIPPLPLEEDDPIFRSITDIQPYYNYSPTAEYPGQYLCPQPSDMPADQRARCPEIMDLPVRGSTDRYFAHIHYHWCASNLSHKPLYFEDVPLERYGQTFPFPVQPFVSVGKFGVQLIGLPYQMALDPVWREHYALGYYQPGDCAPELLYQIPLNAKAAATAAGVYTGFIFLIP